MALTRWNLFVKKVFHEGRKKNSTYKFKDALKDASKRKSEMKTSTTSTITNSSNKNKSRKRRRSK